MSSSLTQLTRSQAAALSNQGSLTLTEAGRKFLEKRNYESHYDPSKGLINLMPQSLSNTWPLGNPTASRIWTLKSKSKSKSTISGGKGVSKSASR